MGDYMELSEMIKQISLDINIPCFYLKRPADYNNCIVYTYTEVPGLMGDMKELGTKFTILFNLYCESDVEDTKQLVKKTLELYNFKKKIITGTLIEKNNIYNTAFQYTITLKSNQDEKG